MEHIIQFGVTVDDEAIKKRIVEQAANAVVNEVKKELGVDRSYYNENMVRRLVNTEVSRLFNESKADIIEATAKALADKLVKTKAVKEATAKVIEDVLKEK